MRFARVLVGGIALGMGAGSVWAWRLPPFAGTVRGELTAFGAEGPRLEWSLTAEPAGEAERDFRLLVRVPGGGPEVVVRGVVASSGEEVRWRVEPHRSEVAAWVAWLGPALPEGLMGAEVGGRLELEGAGSRGADGWDGRLEVRLSEGRWRGGDGTQEATGVAGRWDVRLREDLAVEATGGLTVERARVANLEMTDAHFPLAVAWPDPVVRVEGATLRAFDGEVAVEPFAFRPGDTRLRAAVNLRQADLAALAPYVPNAIRTAEGEVSGRFALIWDLERGFDSGEGRLRLERSAPVEISLAPQPGFLTSNVPRRLALLPAWLGPVARWFSPVNPVYETLRQIEMGEMPLRVESMNVELLPPDDPSGRTARVQIEARPKEARAVERVTLEVNVAGPLAEVLRLGLDETISFRGISTR